MLLKLVLGSQIMGLNPSSACVYLVTLGRLVHFSVPASQIPDLEWTHEDHEIIQAYKLLPETLGQMWFRFQNFCYFIKDNMVHVPYVS